MASLSSLFRILVLCFLLIPIPISCHAPLFIFGDSLFDSGNNNYINTTTAIQSNFLPYGETFFKYPTGRFSDGRLIPDFIGEYAEVPLISPYLLQPESSHQFRGGANFASAGAGALLETHQGFVIDLKTQLRYFEKVEKGLRHTEAKKVLSKAVYLISIGSNDYVSPFVTNSTLFQSHSPTQYVDMVIANLSTVIHEIYKKGGRKFGFVNLAPLGCLPRTRILKPENKGDCMEEITALAKLHNKVLSKLLERLEDQLKGFKYSNFDLFISLTQRMNHPTKYGFKEGKAACCGTGPFKGVPSCGGKRAVKEYQLCDNTSEYVYFDSAHPTEMANKQFAELMWSGTPEVVAPYNLKALFEYV